MLFSGLACFSPSVAPTIRKLWVRNGGTLTHTDDDFKRANYFFCDGMDDPWLNELLSRRLIVRHASWVTLCVDEEFCMPIAAYTLDDGFDVTKIRILEPLGTPQTDGTILTNPMEEVPDDILQKCKAISRKRPFDHDSLAHEVEEQQRPRKKARILNNVHALVFPELYVKNNTRSTALGGSVLKPDVVPHFNVLFPKPPKKAGAAVCQRFLSRIRQTPADGIS